MSERRLRTDFQFETDKRNEEWLAIFLNEIARGSSRMAIYQAISKKYGFSVGHVGKTIRQLRHA